MFCANFRFNILDRKNLYRCFILENLKQNVDNLKVFYIIYLIQCNLSNHAFTCYVIKLNNFF